MKRTMSSLLLSFVMAMLFHDQALAQFFTCGFENSTWCVSEHETNELKTFGSLGIPALTGGGTYCATAKSKTNTGRSAEQIRFYYSQHHTSTLYARMYFYIPTGYQARGGHDLKFLGMEDTSSSDVGNQFILKLRESGGPNGSGTVYLELKSSQPIGGSEFSVSRDTWHYVEFMVQDNGSNDQYKVWFDADSRNAAPIDQKSGGDFVFNGWKGSTVYANNNWSGSETPQSQEFYVDGLAADSQPIGDTYGLLSGGGDPSPPPGDPSPGGSSFPVDLFGSGTISNEVSTTVNVSKPSGATSADLLLVGVFDADQSNEGELLINGNSLSLFGSQAVGSNDTQTVDIGFSGLQASWFNNGDNTFLFKHLSGGGYRVQDAFVVFEGGSSPPPGTGSPPPGTVSTSGFPVQLWGNSTTEVSTTADINKPSDATTATLTLVNVHDADIPDEGELFVNGVKRLDLFAGSLHPDRSFVDVVYSVSASWFNDGNNTLLFKVRDNTGGYDVDDVIVNFQ